MTSRIGPHQVDYLFLGCCLRNDPRFLYPFLSLCVCLSYANDGSNIFIWTSKSFLIENLDRWIFNLQILAIGSWVYIFQNCPHIKSISNNLWLFWLSTTVILSFSSMESIIRHVSGTELFIFRCVCTPALLQRARAVFLGQREKERERESERRKQADLTGCTEGIRAYSFGTSSSSSSSLAKYKCDWLSAGAVAVAVGGDVSRPWGVTGSDSSLQKQWDMSSAGKERAHVRAHVRHSSLQHLKQCFPRFDV